MYMRLQVKHPLFLPDFNQTCPFSTDFRYISNTKFHQTPSGRSRVVPCCRSEGRKTGMTKLTVGFLSFMKALNMIMKFRLD